MVLLRFFSKFDVPKPDQGQNQENPVCEFSEYFQTEPKAPSKNSYSKVPTTESSIVFFFLILEIAEVRHALSVQSAAHKSEMDCSF